MVVCPLRLKKWAYVFFILVVIAAVAAASAVYVFFFLPHGLSSAETAGKLNSLYSRASVIMSNMSDYINDYINKSIDNSTFVTRIANLETEMTALRTDLTELRKVAFPTYIRSIDLLDQGLQWYTDALGYAQNFDFLNNSLFLKFGTEDVSQSTYVLQPLHGLSSAETAGKLNSLYSRTHAVFGNMSDYIVSYAVGGIGNSTFKTLMATLETNMTALRTELTELRKVAFPTYTRSIDLLDQGLQWYIDALGSAQKLEFDQTLQFSQWGTEDIVQSAYVLQNMTSP
jgi:hypothetical protein